MYNCSLSNILLIGALALFGCGGEAPETEEVFQASTSKVDLILYNANVLTLDETSAIASAVVVNGGRIVEVGNDAVLSRYEAAVSRDLMGRTLMPGFIDTHVHAFPTAPNFIDMRSVSSIDEMKALVAVKAEELKPGSWISGYGWSEQYLEERRMPVAANLDAAAPDNPVILFRLGGHSAVASSRALELAKINDSTPDPAGGKLERDEQGRITGVIRERTDLIYHLVPEPSPESTRPGHVALLKDFFAMGVTSFVEATQATFEDYEEWEKTYAEHRGSLPRAYIQFEYVGREEMSAFGRKTGDGDEFLKVGSIKIFADGGYTGASALTLEPYKGQPKYFGRLTMEENELRDLILQAHQDGWQMAIHTIGDGAITLAVDHVIEALEVNPRLDHRHFLNHFTVTPAPQVMEDMAAHGVAISQQPNFIYKYEGLYNEHLTGERLDTNNPLRTPMNHNIHMALSSDIIHVGKSSDLQPIGPFLDLYTAVTRKGRSGRVYSRAERISMLEALKGYTINAAYLTFEEDIKGSLEAGKFADMIVLSADPLTAIDEDILNIRVLQTYLGGRLVYEDAGSLEN